MGCTAIGVDRVSLESVVDTGPGEYFGLSTT